jgi:hypothetical protein
METRLASVLRLDSREEPPPFVQNCASMSVAVLVNGTPPDGECGRCRVVEVQTG